MNHVLHEEVGILHVDLFLVYNMHIKTFSANSTETSAGNHIDISPVLLSLDFPGI